MYVVTATNAPMAMEALVFYYAKVALTSALISPVQCTLRLINNARGVCRSNREGFDSGGERCMTPRGAAQVSSVDRPSVQRSASPRGVTRSLTDAEVGTCAGLLRRPNCRNRRRLLQHTRQHRIRMTEVLLHRFRLISYRVRFRIAVPSPHRAGGSGRRLVAC